MEAGQLSSALALFGKANPGIDVRVSARTTAQLFDEARVREFLDNSFRSDVLIIVLHGSQESFPGFAAFEKRMAKDGRKPFVHVQPSASDVDGLEWAARHSTAFKTESYDRAYMYLCAGGRENFRELIKLFANEALGAGLPLDPPRILPFDGIYHPDWDGPADIPKYMASLDPEKPTVGLWFHQIYWLNGNLLHVDRLIREIEAAGANALPVFHMRYKDKDLKNMGALGVAERYFLGPDGKPVIDCLLSAMSFSMTLSSPETKGLFKRLGVPVIQACYCFSPREAWAGSWQGLPSMDVSMSVAQPEFDGNLICVPFSFREQERVDPITRALIVSYEPDAERSRKLASFACNWARLGRTPNPERRVAIVFHHYPPRNDRIGCAAGLDSFRSVSNILRELKAAGYRVDRLYDGEDELAHEMLSRMTTDRRWLTPDRMSQRAEARAGRKLFESWHGELPASVREKMLKDWGELPGELFTHEDEMLFPGLANGNVFIGIQPPRGLLENIEAIYHDFHLTPPHHYLAQYRWYRDVWGAQALIHVGKHGSLEWLPGKALGLSETCYPDLSIMDIPNVYPYIINDPGEGTQAKRRSYACIIDHLIPAQTNAGLYDEIAKADALAADYRLAEREDPKKLPILRDLIIAQALKADLDKDLSLTEEAMAADFEGFLERLHDYVDQLQDTMIADGLHVLGECPEGKRLSEFLVELTRIEGPGAPSLREAILASKGHSLDEALAFRGKANPAWGGRTGAEILREARDIGVRLMEALLEENFDKAAIPMLMGSIAKSAHPPLEDALSYVCDTLVPSLRGTTAELGSTLTALAGGFVEPGPSGAPTRGQCDILPTGRNFYSVDPNKIPSPAAWDLGRALGDALIKRSLEETGKYPENIGILVYGTSTMRTRGDDVAEIYYLLGLRPVWRQGGTVSGLEVIPLSELGRPRLDVTPRISGFFRDSFPNIVETLDHAVQMVAKLNEPAEGNFVRAHVLADVEGCVAQGMDREKAWREATFRVFGCPPGTYGAGVAELVEAKKWETKEDLGEIYIRYSGHAYGKDAYGLSRQDAFRRNLARMDVTVKNEDSREYDMMSCTDYYNYYGGLIAASHTVRGVAPLSLMGDSSDPRRVKVRSTEEEAKHVLRARLINPKWLSGLKRHGYKGAGDISHMMDVMFGWDATADVMEDWMYRRVAETYALDQEMREWMERVNPFARQNILDKLLEAASRGMWDADEETLRKLQEEYLELEGKLEEWNDEDPAKKDLAV
jgi:cobaltochelatase CobN